MKRLLYGVLLPFFFGASPGPAAETLSPLPFTRITVPPKTLSLPIAAPLSGGPLRILFFGQREMIGVSWSEITSRLDCTSESVLTESRGELSPARMPASPDSVLLSHRNISDRASKLLGLSWDVIWLDSDFASLPELLRKSLLERVNQGSGLVYVGKAADLKGIARSGKFDRNMLRGMSFSSRAPEYAGELGRGIILAIPEFDRRSLPRETGDYFAEAVNAILLASGRFSGFGVTGIKDRGKDIEHESMSIMNFRVDFRNEGAGALRTVRARYRDESGQVVHESENSYDINHGKGFFRVTYPMLPLGAYSADISIIEEGKVIALAGNTFHVRSEDMLEAIMPRNFTAISGEFLTGRVRMSREMDEGMALVVELFDHLGRRINRSELVPETKRKWEDYAFKATEDMGGMMRFRASLHKNNKLIHTLSETVFVRKAEKNRRFSLIVKGKAEDAPWLIPGYAQLVDAGVKAFALDMTGKTPAEASRAALWVFQAGGEPIPVFPLGTRTTVSGGTSEMLAVADTLRQMPILDCWVGETGKVGRPETGNGSYRSTTLSTYLEAGKSGGLPPALPSVLPSELFFDRGREYDPYELRIAPWRNLFQGIGAVCWTGVSGKAGDALVPGGGLNPTFSVLAEECLQIKGGVDLLLSGARRDDGETVLVRPDRSGAKATLFRDGAIRYVGVLPEPGGDADSTGIPVTVKIAELSSPMHLYDVREGSYRGQATDIPFTMKSNEAALFALLPYRVKDIEVRFSGGVVSAGGQMDFNASIVAQETGEKIGRHVLSLRFYGPDGKERFWLRSEREAHEGELHVSFRIPSVEPPGKWTLQVRDVLSGKMTERPFIIMPSGK